MIYTVTGDVDKENLGVMLAHEHLDWDSSNREQLYFEKVYDREKIDEVYGKLLPVFKQLYQQGCRAVVETSPPYGGQNLKLMQLLSEESGVRIIANTGKVFTPYISQIFQSNYEQDLADRWIKDFEEGLDRLNGVTIRPGYIKLLLDNNFTEVSKKDVKAAVLASKATGMPIHCHILEPELAEEIISLLDKEKFDFNNFLWAHASYGWVREGYQGRFELLKEAGARGMWLGLDTIKPENYIQHCDLLARVIDSGLQDRIIISQDYDFYEEVVKGNSQVLTGLFTDFIPYCADKGISRETILQILTKNHAEFYNIER